MSKQCEMRVPMEWKCQPESEHKRKKWQFGITDCEV